MTVVTSLKAPEEISFMTAWELPSVPNWESYSVAFKQFRSLPEEAASYWL